jgi:hypothetical protein
VASNLLRHPAVVACPASPADKSSLPDTPALIPVKIRHMKQPRHLAVECLMAAKERLVDLADLDGSRSAFAVIA